MPGSEDGKDTLEEEFKKVFGTTDHPLLDKFRNDLIGGRSLNAVMTDLREAEVHRTGNGPKDDGRLFIASL